MIDNSVANNGQSSDLGNKSYAELYRPSSNFATRNEYLNHELQIMQPKRWKINLPFRDYRFELEDTIPAIAATIGKIVMVGGDGGGICYAFGTIRCFHS
ncbi:DUF3360 domain-containing protein [Moraxella sp. ZY200743]